MCLQIIFASVIIKKNIFVNFILEWDLYEVNLLYVYEVVNVILVMPFHILYFLIIALSIRKNSKSLSRVWKCNAPYRK